MYSDWLGIRNKWRIINFALKEERFTLTIAEMTQILGHPKYERPLEQIWADLTCEKLKRLLSQQNYLTYFDANYPRLLKEIADPPLFLFYEGDISLLDQHLLGVVGARAMTSYGVQVVQKLVPEMVKNNYVVLSGLARGVDSFSHQMAIQAHGKTIGVLGTGIERCYPKEVLALYQEMKQNHLIISEFPYGSKVYRYNFPLRNRIIAGLCEGLCVIEAKEKSGSLITAKLALENGREVFAIPGEILKPSSMGCLRLIQDGAKCVLSFQDILEELPVKTWRIGATKK
ncbi:MAG: DNA-processing protein DprA [Enterococcus sp.]